MDAKTYLRQLMAQGQTLDGALRQIQTECLAPGGPGLAVLNALLADPEVEAALSQQQAARVQAEQNARAAAAAAPAPPAAAGAGSQEMSRSRRHKQKSQKRKALKRGISRKYRR